MRKTTIFRPSAGFILSFLCVSALFSFPVLAQGSSNDKEAPVVQTESSTITEGQAALDAKSKETAEALKGKEQDIKQSAVLVESLKEEKKVVEKEAEIKKQQADIKKEEAMVLKKEAQASSDRSLQKKSEQLLKEAGKLEKESEIYKEKLSTLEAKETGLHKTLAAQQEQIDALTKSLSGLNVGKAAYLPLKQKIFNAIPEVLTGLVILLLLNIFKGGVEKILAWKEESTERALTLRIRTITKLIAWAGGIMVFIYIVFSVLEDFGVSVMPLLAGAGIAGIAFGFGGQYLIRDLINGIFILLEDQYRIGDVVSIGELGGLVEDINLRITTLRDLQGRVTIIPNGEIKSVMNYTKGYSQALMDIGVAYKENVDRVMEIIKEIGKDMRIDSYFGKLILDDLEMLGVDDFADSAVIIRFRIKTAPIKQWEVMREFRRRLKNRFDELGIQIPFPHRTLYWGKDQLPQGN